MTFQIDIGGRTRRVSIERAGSGAEAYSVRVDGQAYLVEGARIGEYGLSLIVGTGTFSAPAAARTGTVRASTEVQVVPAGPSGEVLVWMGGRVVTATVNGRRRSSGAADADAHAQGEQPVIAPMPGRIVRVLVGRGDAVTARQSVVVVEAMKMENELRSPKPGRVKEVNVEPGMSVDAGRVLMVIE